MASTRVPVSLLLRTARTAIVRTSKPHLRLYVQQPRPVLRAPTCLTGQARWQSQDAQSNAGGATSKFYAFEDVQKLIAKPSKDLVLVDSREPSELQSTGRIPGAINIPVTSSPDAFFLSEEEFEDRFGFQRPSKDTEVVFYCKAGVRSRAAAELARQAGWQRTSEYAGSWTDWSQRGGEVER